mmetsp:Transcript_39139/g.110632  ORF Transcript_39139/g.110632 Transcript_39139/m.110632 type:complete len:100 (+) Transcript_39139:1478-1777(+)
MSSIEICCEVVMPSVRLCIGALRGTLLVWHNGDNATGDCTPVATYRGSMVVLHGCTWTWGCRCTGLPTAGGCDRPLLLLLLFIDCCVCHSVDVAEVCRG